MIAGGQETISEYQGGHGGELGVDWVSDDSGELQSSSDLMAFRLFP